MNRVLKLSEKEVLRSVKDLLKVEGFFVIRNMAGLGSCLGLSDLIAIKDGIVLFVETKASGGKISEHQLRFKHEIESRGGNYLLINDVDELIDFLQLTNLGSSRLF